jgi:hypothetical protein
MKKDAYFYILSKFWLWFIIIYFIAIILSGIIVSIMILSNISNFVLKNILLYTSFVSIAVSAMLCSVQYLRRLYKACLGGGMQLVKSDDEIKQFGYIMYFILRPIYAIVFVLIAVFALLAGIIFVVPIDYNINERFLYLCVVMASIIGFSIGRILDGFETLSSKHINNIFSSADIN